MFDYYDDSDDSGGYCFTDDDEYADYYYAYNCEFKEDYSKELRSVRQKVNWDIEKERRKFLGKLFYLVHNWKGQLPNLREFFRREDVDWIIVEYLDGLQRNYGRGPDCSFIKFVIRTGYKDEPELDKDGKPVLSRTTPLHYASEEFSGVVRYYPTGPGVFNDLFQIYNRYDANYLGEYGLTHFHVACRFGCKNVVEKFLELGQDPNVLVQKTGASPLHLALAMYALESPGRDEVLELLLKNGADVNLTNAKGLTPLHVICKDRKDDNLAEMFFKLNDQIQQTIQLDARDKLGRTPLQMAVASLMPKTVDALLDRIADLSDFVFPTEDYFGAGHKGSLFVPTSNDTNLASRTLMVIESLKKKGYEINQTHALTTMKFFNYIGVVRQSLAFMFTGDYDSDDSEPGFEYCTMCHSSREAPKEPLCHAHKSTIISRGFFQHWSLGFFLKLTHPPLPTRCCKIIIDKLSNKDLFNVCIAVDSAMKEQSQTLDVNVEEIEELKNLHITE
ncbi:uncharacterized protein LOC106655852 isoform X2 [Trichogramma pretiosum]|uniref:uncharacterized protein LOC106655852 isoform X2 n=1 Tax=Trichogramma pretiosum TaxID=7493 RepID=UPI0006C94889|nr:uncharacterized protein LOC106655852 isoform X2 [Trichogramma pretiosum]